VAQKREVVIVQFATPEWLLSGEYLQSRAPFAAAGIDELRPTEAQDFDTFTVKRNFLGSIHMVAFDGKLLVNIVCPILWMEFKPIVVHF
jgi:hypothetical protein